MPSQSDLKPSQPGLRPSQLGLRPSQLGLRPSQPGFRSSQPSLFSYFLQTYYGNVFLNLITKNFSIVPTVRILIF